jgi:hypothetical protein
LTLNNATISGPGSWTQIQTLALAGESFVDNAIITGLVGNAGPTAGTLHITGAGQFSVPTLSGGTIQVDAAAQMVLPTSTFIAGSQIVNHGTLYDNVSATGGLFSSQINVAGTLTNTNLMVVESNIFNNGTINNSGLLTNYAALATPARTITPTIINTGTISGGFVISNMTSSGVLSPDAGTAIRTLTLQQTLNLQNGALITTANNGIIILSATVRLDGASAIDHASLSITNFSGTGTVTLNSVNTWNASTLASGIIDIAAGGTLVTTAAGAGLTSSAALLVNHGCFFVGFTPGIGPNGSSFNVSAGIVQNESALLLDSSIGGSGRLINDSHRRQLQHQHQCLCLRQLCHPHIARLRCPCP